MSMGERIYVRKKYIGIYRALIDDSPASPRIFTKNKDLFTLCTTIGFKSGKKNQIKNTEMLLWSGTLDEHQETVLRSIAVKSSEEQNLNILDEPGKVYKIAEEYADHGMEILIEDIFKPFIKVQDDEMLTIAYNAQADLLKTIIHYVENLVEENSPFD